jgi:hypothetical protein
MVVSVTSTPAFHFHLPWWMWALAELAIVVTAFEEQQRAARRARHHAYLKSPEWKARRRGALARGRCHDCGTTRRDGGRLDDVTDRFIGWPGL